MLLTTLRILATLVLDMHLPFKLNNTAKELQLYIGCASKSLGCIGCTRTYTSQKCREARAARALCLSPLKEAKPSPVCAFHVREFSLLIFPACAWRVFLWVLRFFSPSICTSQYEYLQPPRISNIFALLFSNIFALLLVN